MLRMCLSLVLLFSTVNFPAQADDWPQWLGPQRDSVWRETGLVESFPEKGLPVKWRVPIGGGYSGPAVANGKVFVTDYVKSAGEPVNDPGQRPKLKGKERVLCLDATTGKQVWKHDDECSYAISYPAGPRTTPTVDGGNVFTLGAEGHLLCLDAAKGSVVWSKELKQEYRCETPTWGFCGHPLIDGGKLICLVGGEGSVAVAFNKTSGQEIWRSMSARQPGYCPPTMIQAAGQKQLLIWDADNLNALNPETGKKLWSFKLTPQYDMTIGTPRQSGDLLFACGIGNVSACLKLKQDQPGAEVLWIGGARKGVDSSHSTPFVENGMIYSDSSDKGLLRGVKLETGDRVWEATATTTGRPFGSNGTVFLVKQADRFFLFTEAGDLVLAKLTPNAYEEISRFHVLEPTGECFGRNVVWSHPAFANKCCFARNDKEIVCVSLAK